MPSSTADTADSQNSESGSENIWITHNVYCVTDSAAASSGIQPSPDLQNPSTCSQSHNVTSTVAESDNQTSERAEHPSDGLSAYEMCASPPPNDCLNDIWLSSAAVDLGSPLMLRSSASCTVVHECAN